MISGNQSLEIPLAGNPHAGGLQGESWFLEPPGSAGLVYQLLMFALSDYPPFVCI